MADDLTERKSRDEWFYLMEKYPKVAFNYKSCYNNIQLPNQGFRHLLAAEPHIEIPENWNLDIIAQYDSYITYNKKMYEKCQSLPNTKTYLIKGCPACNQYFSLDKFCTYDDKIKGVVALNKIGNTGREGDIYYMRRQIMEELSIDPMVKHVWARDAWGGKAYQGSIPFFHSHTENLKKINQYLFCLCLESTYHPFWSYGFITERMFNCFKSKTVPIYMGCYNIEDYVPSDLFIDYRKFESTLELSHYLRSFDKKKYTDMTEKAFEWNKTNDIGSIANLEKLLGAL